MTKRSIRHFYDDSYFGCWYIFPNPRRVVSRNNQWFTYKIKCSCGHIFEKKSWALREKLTEPTHCQKCRTKKEPEGQKEILDYLNISGNSIEKLASFLGLSESTIDVILYGHRGLSRKKLFKLKVELMNE
jgi:hypothetical protein